MDNGLRIFVISLFMLVLALISVIVMLFLRRRAAEKVKQMELDSQVKQFKIALEAEEKQKSIIAKNLHDQFVPQLSIVLRKIESRAFDPFLKECVDDLQRISSGVRDIAYDITPKILLSDGLVKTLELFINDLDGLNDTVAKFHHDETDNTANFSKSDQLHIYRICLEVLNNLYKHAQYKCLSVTLEGKESTFILSFVHDGIPVTNEEINKIRMTGSSLGLSSLHSRTSMLNGTIHYGIENELSLVRLIIPVNNENN